MFLNKVFSLLLILKIIIFNLRNSHAFKIKNKEGIISLVENKGYNNNISGSSNSSSSRKCLINNVARNNEIKNKIISFNENEIYIKKKLKQIENFRITQYSSKYTFFFPGQGEQYISMGVNSYDKCKHAKEIYERASQILGYNLMDVIKHGPLEKLKDSEIAQPAIYTVSVAAYERLKCENREATEKLNLCMGYSLGEYAALTCANSLPFEEGVYLTRERGKAMQESAKLYEMTTVAIVGLNLDNIYKLIKDVNKEMNDDVFIVSYMTDRKFGLCGKPSSMEYLSKLAKEKYKSLFTKKLNISGAFHSSYMFPAKETLEKILKQINFKKLDVPIISNVDGYVYDDPVIIKELLLLQLTSPIKINLCLQNILKNGYESGYELGPGNINVNLIKDLSKKSKTAIPYI